MKSLDSKLPESRRKLLQAAWATPIVAAVSLPKHAQATTIPPGTTPTVVVPAIDCGDDPITAANENIAANLQGTLTDNGAVLQTSFDVYHEPMQSVFEGGSVSIEATDGTLLPDTEDPVNPLSPDNPNYDSQESADINATLRVAESDIPCFLPDQPVEVCVMANFNNEGPGSTYQGGTGLSLYTSEVLSSPTDSFGMITPAGFVAGSGSLTIAGGGSDSAMLCHTFTAQDLVDGVVFRITAETHQFGIVKSWNIDASYTLTWM